MATSRKKSEPGRDSAPRNENVPRDSRRGVLVAIALVAVIMAVSGWFALRGRQEATARHAAARDVILVTIDTLRADALGFAGNSRVKTPFLDSLAARGVVFTNAHAHNVITLPSHVNILTGLYPYQHGVRENAGFKLDPKFETVATMLKRSGFATAAFIGAFPLDSRFGLKQGFDLYDDNYGKGESSVDFVVQERPAAAVLASATKWWNSTAGKKRFMWIHLYDPHAPYAPPEPFRSTYRDNEYLGEVAYADSQLQSQLAPILQADPDALVIVTGDHGEALGDHGEQTHGLFAYEATLKIPLVVAGPGIDHRNESGYVRHVDIVPTILEAAGATAPKALPGASLLGDPKGRDSYFESLSASLNRGWAPLTGIIHDGLKYIDLPVAELYDLARDPKETNNLRDARRRDVELARKLLAPMTVPAAPGAVDSDTLAKLRSLGYISGSATPKKSYTASDDPKNLVALDSLMHEAIDAFERRDTQRALKLARQLVAARPEMAAGRELLAFMLQQNDLVGEAIHELESMTKGAGASDDNRVQLALLYSETGQPRKAVELLAPRAATNDPDVLNAYGVALSGDGKPDEAARQFERVLQIDPANAPAYQNLGILALQRNDEQNAQMFLSRALELNPRLPIALNTIGVLYARMNRPAEAVNAWKRAVEIDSRQYDALFNTGLVAGRAGMKDDARQALQRFIATAPPSRYASDIATAKKVLAAL